MEFQGKAGVGGMSLGGVASVNKLGTKRPVCWSCVGVGELLKRDWEILARTRLGRVSEISSRCCGF